MRYSLAVAAVAVAAATALHLFMLGSAFAGALREDCTSDWSVASRIVSEQNLTTVEQLAAEAKQTLGGSIVRSSLCRKNGSYTYQLLIRERGGGLKRARVDARRPFR